MWLLDHSANRGYRVSDVVLDHPIKKFHAGRLASVRHDGGLQLLENVLVDEQVSKLLSLDPSKPTAPLPVQRG